MADQQTEAFTAEDIDADLDESLSGLQVPPPFPDSEVNRLPIQLALVVPSTRGDSQLTKGHFENRIDFTRKWFSSTFGADTTVRASGGYIGEGGHLVDEEVALVESSTTIRSYMENVGDFRDFIIERYRNWGQDTIGYKIEGQFYTYPEKPYIDDEVSLAENLIAVE